MSTVREVTFDLLRQLGMTMVFGNPGSTELPFLRDFPDDFRYILGLQEASVLGMADGYAQGTGQAAFVNLHTGPGLGNAMGAMVTAWHNRTPLVVTAGQQDRRHLVLDPMLSGNLVELAQPYVKRSHEPERAEDVPRELMRAYHMAMQAPKGPVFVSIPMNDWDVECEPPPSHEVYHEPVPDSEGIKKFAQVLAGAERPAIVAGAWVDRKGAFYDTVALAEKLKAAVWEAPLASRAGFPQNHPLFQGSLAPAQKQVAEQLSGHDVVLVLGAPVFLYYPYVPVPSSRRAPRYSRSPATLRRPPAPPWVLASSGTSLTPCASSSRCCRRSQTAQPRPSARRRRSPSPRRRYRPPTLYTPSRRCCRTRPRSSRSPAPAGGSSTST